MAGTTGGGRGVIVVRLLGLVFASGLVVGLTACMGHWFTPEQGATLIIGKPAVFGNRGEVLISVTDMPDQGLASIAIDDQGITYNGDIDAASIEAEGLNGFTVLAQDFTTTANKGRLVAANPLSGSVGGTILKITFEVIGANPAFGIEDADKGKVEMGSHLNTLITTWDLSSRVADYYAK